MKIEKLLLAAGLGFFGLVSLTAASPGTSGSTQAEITVKGDIIVPAMNIPSSDLMSDEGNRSRIEHIAIARELKGKPVEEVNKQLFGPLLALMKAVYPISVRSAQFDGVNVLIYEPNSGTAANNNDKVLINLHGGGFAGCFVECGGLESIPISAVTGLKVISIDYRESPYAKYPAATEDVTLVYKALLKTYKPAHIGLFGCSAGGLLTAQTLAWFQRKGLPNPAAAGIFCAGGDASLTGDSWHTGMLLGDATVVRPDSVLSLEYMRSAAANDPEAYPARDLPTLAKFPPTLIISGTRDFALSTAVNLHSKLVAQQVPSDLHIWEGGRHAFFYDVRVPESKDVYSVIAHFFETRLIGQPECIAGGK